MSHVGCANRLEVYIYIYIYKNKDKNMVLTRNGNVVPVCGFGKAKVDFSVFTVSAGGIVHQGEDFFSRLGCYVLDV